MDFEKIFNETFEQNIVHLNKMKENAEKYRNIILEKFNDIDFIEESHQYIIDGQKYISVSNVIKQYEPVVDWDVITANYAAKCGRRIEDVQREWKLNNLKSTISGTRTHCFGESITNLLCGHPELINIENKNQYVKEFNTLIPTYPKEEAIKKFYDELDSNLYPIGAEFKLSSKYIKDSLKICGTCDLIFYDIKSDGLVIMDWKTNKSLIKEYNRNYNIMMTGCLNNMVDEPLSHYAVQISMYSKMLESIGFNVVSRFIIWLKDDGTYEKIEINKINDNILNKIMCGEK